MSRVGDGDVECHPVLDPVVPLDETSHHLVDAVRLGLCEKSDPAEVDSEDWDVGPVRQFSGAQKCSVTAENDHKLAPGRGIRIATGHRDIGTDIAQVRRIHRKTFGEFGSEFDLTGRKIDARHKTPGVVIDHP